jgi:hypothetical protein
MDFAKPTFLVASISVSQQAGSKRNLTYRALSATHVLFANLLIDVDASVPIDQTPSTEPLLIAERTIGKLQPIAHTPVFFRDNGQHSNLTK